MASKPTVRSSHVAAIGTLPKRSTGFAETALRTGSVVASILTLVPIVGAVGMGISYAMDYAANGVKASNEKTAIAEWYRPQIARQLGIDPSRVSARDLELAASVNPAIHRAVEKINEERNSANTTTAMSAAAGGIASAVIPGAGLVASVGKMAAGMGGGVVGSWLTSPDVLKNPQVILERVIEQRASGRVITPMETFMLRVSQRDELQKAIKEKTGREYYELSPEQHGILMQQFPRIAGFAEKDAAYLNRGGDARELMFVLPERHWETRVKQEAARVQGEPVRG